MQAVAAELSGYAGNLLRSSSYGVSTKRERSRHSEATAEFRCFWRGEFKNSLFRFIYFKTARNELVASAFAG
jgi:hypothetical protein